MPGRRQDDIAVQERRTYPIAHCVSIPIYLYWSLTHFFALTATGRWSIVSKSPKGLYLLGKFNYYYLYYTIHRLT